MKNLHLIAKDARESLWYDFRKVYPQIMAFYTIAESNAKFLEPREQFLGIVAAAPAIPVATALAALFAWLVTLEITVAAALAALLTSLGTGGMISLPRMPRREVKDLSGNCRFLKLNCNVEHISGQ